MQAAYEKAGEQSSNREAVRTRRPVLFRNARRIILANPRLAPYTASTLSGGTHPAVGAVPLHRIPSAPSGLCFRPSGHGPSAPLGRSTKSRCCSSPRLTSGPTPRPRGAGSRSTISPLGSPRSMRSGPHPRLEPVLRAGLVSLIAGDDHLVEIELDHGSQGGSAGRKSALPLRFNWWFGVPCRVARSSPP